MAIKKYKCKFCNTLFFSINDYASHIESEHSFTLPHDMNGKQFIYYLKSGKTNGNCIICKNKTGWNDKTNKYNRFCDNPKCKEKYREIFKKRMIGKYGKTHLLNDAEQQKKMLKNRSISGIYEWSDKIHKSSFTGSYEKEFLLFLDNILNFNPEDVMSPSPHTYYYDYNGEKHFYIPDFFIPSLGVEIEIKDGGNNPNMHHKIQSIDKIKEKLKDDVMSKNEFHYIKISNKDHMKFLDFLEKLKDNFYDGKETKVIVTESNDELTLDKLNKIYVENIERVD